MAKSVKSIRMSDRVSKIIEGYRGDNFSEKLENYVLDMDGRRDQLELDWHRLQAQITDKHAEMREVQERCRKLRTLEARLGPLVDAIVALLQQE